VVGENIYNAISLNSAAASVSRSVGPALSAILIQFLGVDASYFAQAALYGIATIWTAQIHESSMLPQSDQSPASAKNNQSLFSSAKDGFAYIGANPLILALIILGLAPILLGMPYTSLMPIFA
jgi:hypothetical protein